MDRMSRLLAFNVVLVLGICNATADESPHSLHRISLLPHQAGICDVIFAGTVVSTNFTAQSPRFRFSEHPAAEFAVDDVLWGTVASSNIIVGSVYQSDVDNFMPGERYLVCAFTNDWWANMSRGDTELQWQMEKPSPQLSRTWFIGFGICPEKRWQAFGQMQHCQTTAFLTAS